MQEFYAATITGINRADRGLNMTVTSPSCKKGENLPAHSGSVLRAATSSILERCKTATDPKRAGSVIEWRIGLERPT